MPKLTKEQLIKIHKELHNSLDKLLACYIQKQTSSKNLTNTSLIEFLEWSHKQTIDPSCFEN